MSKQKTRIKINKGINKSFVHINKTLKYLITKEIMKIKHLSINNKEIKKEEDKLFTKIRIKLINIIMINLFLILNLFKVVISNIYHYNLNRINHFSNITLKVKGTGYSNILGHGDSECSSCIFDNNNYPSKIYINGYIKEVSYNYNFVEIINTVNMIWEGNINTCLFLFRGCTSITEVDLTNFATSGVNDMGNMFYGCTSLTSVNLSNLDTSNVIYMSCMFQKCSALTFLDLSSFVTSQVKYMNQMFDGCSSLTSLIISSFDTSNVEEINHMFQGCSSLVSLNVSNFDTSNVKKINGMFNGCSGLTSLNVSNFKTSSLTDIGGMFYDCASLISLDLSNFDTSKVEWFCYLFDGCSNLQFINLLNFDESKVGEENKYYTNMFTDVPDNVVICINDINNKNKILSQINTKSCPLIDCSDDWKLKRQKIISETGTCINNCTSTYKFENNGKCYEECNNYFYLDDNNIYHCTQSCPNDYPILKGNECISNNIHKSTEIIQKELSTISLLETIIITQSQIDQIYKSSIIIKEQYSTMLLSKEKVISTEAQLNSENYLQKSIEIIKEKNSSLIFSSELTIKIENDTQMNIKYTEIKDMIKDVLEKNNETTEDKYYDNILEQVESSFTSENYDPTKLDNRQDEIIELDKMKITLTTIENQKNLSNNMTAIYLGECETSLRNYYNITNNNTIYIKKIDINQEGMRIPKVEYELYYKLSGIKLKKINITICQKNIIFILIPIEIKENLDILNSTSGYYNDICYPTTSGSGTDISLKDRQNEYINKVVCQDDCNFTDYYYIIKKANCSCKVKESPKFFANMKINKTKLYENFVNIENIANIKILICYKKLFNTDGIIYNIGFYIIACILLFHIISIFIFYLKQFDIIKNKIEEITFGITHRGLLKSDEKRETKKYNTTKVKRKKQENEVKKSMGNILDKKKKTNILNNKNNDNKLILSSQKNINKINKKPKASHNKNNFININLNENNITNENITYNIINSNNKKIKKKFIPKSESQKNILKNKNQELNKEKIIKKVKNILEYNSDEKNLLDYELALQYDRRTYCEYYISLLKTKHNLFFAFFYNDDYNSKIIKLDLFFISFSIFYTVNAIFFNDHTMHKIYITEGKFNLEYQLPKIIYSSLISMVLNSILKILALSNKGISELKQNKSKEEINSRQKELENKLKIKFVLYFMISFMLLFFFWYYISLFGVIYRNTQLHLLKDTLISFGLSLIYPFAIYLLPGLLRIPSLSNPKKKKRCLYQLSKILQIL